MITKLQSIDPERSVNEGGESSRDAWISLGMGNTIDFMGGLRDRKGEQERRGMDQVGVEMGWRETGSGETAGIGGHLGEGYGNIMQ